MVDRIKKKHFHIEIFINKSMKVGLYIDTKKSTTSGQNKNTTIVLIFFSRPHNWE